MNEHSTVHWQWSFADCRWYSTPPLVSLLVLVNMSTSHRFFATSSIGCQCLRGYNWVLTAYEAYISSIACTVADNSGHPVSTWRSVCSMNQNNQVWKVELLHRSSSCLELTATSLSFPVHQSQSVSSRAQDSSFQAGLSLTFPLRTIEEIELNYFHTYSVNFGRPLLQPILTLPQRS